MRLGVGGEMGWCCIRSFLGRLLLGGILGFWRGGGRLRGIVTVLLLIK